MAEIHAALARPMPWGWAAGLLPDAPAEAVCHLRPVTLGEALDAQREARAALGADWTPEASVKALLLRAVHVDPEDFCPPGTPQIDPGRLVPAFERADEIPDADAGLAAVVQAAEPEAMLAGLQRSSPILLMFALMQVSGSPAGAADAPADTFSAWRERRRHGRLVTGCLPQDPALAVRVTAPTRETLEGCALRRDEGGLSHLPYLLSRCLVAEDGERLLTEEQARLLPFGGAVHLADVAEGLLQSNAVMPTLHRVGQGETEEAETAQA